jgi:tRNA A-37 threonylcarbamoyl transferase component Bud32
MSYTRSAPEKVILNLSRLHRQSRSAVRIFSIGDIGLDEAFMNFPDPFLRTECKVVKCEEKIKVGFMPLRISGTTKTVYVKQHNALSFGRRLGSLFLPSAAVRSLFGAVTLLREGYATAKPLAVVEYRTWGVLTKSLYLSEQVSGAKTIDTFWHEDLTVLTGADGYQKRRAFLRALARLLSSLHRRRIYHNDLKASNILILAREAPMENLLSVIDVQGLKQCFYVSKRRRIKNLAQLDRTLGRLLTNTQKLFFLKAYGGLAFWFNQRRKQDLIKTILDETKRQITRERLRSRLPN